MGSSGELKSLPPASTGKLASEWLAGAAIIVAEFGWLALPGFDHAWFGWPMAFGVALNRRRS